jgi:hypothetical protein
MKPHKRGEDMGDVIDFVKCKEKMQSNRFGANGRDGVYYVETTPPFIIFKHYEAGALRRECRLISEYILREMLDNMP